MTSARRFVPNGEPVGISTGGAALNFLTQHGQTPPYNVTRVTLYGGVCPCCVRKFKAAPPVDMPTGSPFGTNLRALVIYLRFTQGIAFERLTILLSDILGLDISE